MLYKVYDDSDDDNEGRKEGRKEGGRVFAVS